MEHGLSAHSTPSAQLAPQPEILNILDTLRSLVQEAVSLQGRAQHILQRTLDLPPAPATDEEPTRPVRPGLIGKLQDELDLLNEVNGRMHSTLTGIASII